MKKNKMVKWLSLAALGLALPLLNGNAQAQGTNVTLWTFPNDGNGANYLANAITAPGWGGSTVTFDGTQDANNDPNFGSMYVVANPAISQNGVIVDMYYPSSNPDSVSHIWGTANPEDLTTYTNIEFDFKWDNANSTRTIDDFNVLPQPWGDNGIRLMAILNAGGTVVALTNVYFPTAATNGWVHMNVPINPTLAGINYTIGLSLRKYFNDPNFGQVAFWFENFKLDADIKPPAPPTLGPLVKPLNGLNAVASTSGIYDRHIGRLLANTGKSWVGQATAGHPVTYSFTIKSFPQDPATFYSASAVLLLVPNPTQSEVNSPDWNESDVIVINIKQGSPTNSVMSFQYKVGDPNDGAMYYGNAPFTNAPDSWDGVTADYHESGNLGSVANAGTAAGTWSVMFTSDTNVTLTAPDGTTSSFIFPPYNAAVFAESTGFNVYLGMQPNNTASIGTTIAYSSLAVSNTANPFYENFLTDTQLDTTIWDITMSAANSLVLVPGTIAYNVSWTLPANSYSLSIATNLSDLADGTAPSHHPVVIGATGTASQYVDKSELPSGNIAFFNLIKRQFTQLQVLLPGQTNAPGTALGYVGRPTDVSLAAQGFGTTITVNACDDTWHIVNVSDAIHLTTTDTSAFPPANDVSMVGGTATFSGNDSILFQSQGSWTVTATDTTTPTIPAATSAAVNVVP